MARKRELKVPEPRRMSSGNWFIQMRLKGEYYNITEPDYNTCIARARAIKAGVIKEQAKGRGKCETVGEAVDTYIANKSNLLSPSTIKAYKSYRRTRFQELMDVPVSELTREKVQSAVNAEIRKNVIPNKGSKKIKRVSAKTVLNSIHLIAAALDDKCNIRFDKLTLPEYEADKGRALNFDEMKTFLKEVQKSKYEVPLLLALWCEMRRSEIVALNKADFNFAKKSISVNKALVQNDKNEWVYKEPKTKAGKRIVLCDDYILDKVKDMPDTGGRLFTMHPNTLYNEVQKICKRTDIAHTRLHDLRHTGASLSEYLNIPQKYIMERGGWSSKPILEKVYTHTIDKGIEEAAEKIDTFIKGMLE